MNIIEVKNLYKVFGKHPNRGLKLAKDGKTKDHILEKTGQTIAVNNVSFTIKTGEIGWV